MSEIKPGSTWKHAEGHVVRVLAVVQVWIAPDTWIPGVLYGEREDQYVRPIAAFLERFTEIP